MTFGWSADEATSHRIMDAAYDSGINFLDSADIYSRWVEGNSGGESEATIGRWLKTKNRREIIIATKVRGPMWSGSTGEGLSRHHVMHAVEDSLRRLQTDYIDLYQTHYPDNDTPLEKTLQVLHDLVTSGKVRYIGTSNHPAWLLTRSLWISDVRKISRYETLQPHYSLLHRNEYEQELAALCADQNLGVIPYSPLAAGFLTGKYTRENRQPDSTRASGGLVKRLINDDRAYEALDRLREIAREHSVPVAQVALAWLLAQETVTAPIIGARSFDQLMEVVGAVDVKLSAKEMKILDEVSTAF
jgi:aryl-alcohol dehydrogenase-like predicted oxidoreductase